LEFAKKKKETARRKQKTSRLRTEATSPLKKASNEIPPTRFGLDVKGALGARGIVGKDEILKRERVVLEGLGLDLFGAGGQGLPAAEGVLVGSEVGPGERHAKGHFAVQLAGGGGGGDGRRRGGFDGEFAVGGGVARV